MSGVDWERELERVRAEALAETDGSDEEAALRAGVGAWMRMLVRTGALQPEHGDFIGVSVVDAIDKYVGYEIGSPVAQYARFYLHPYTWVGKDGTRIPGDHYQITLGEVETPIFQPFDFSSVGANWQSKLTSPNSVSAVPVGESEPTHLARRLRRTLVVTQARVAYDREWQRTHPDQAKEREGRIADAERCIAVWEAGLHELEAAYPVAAAADTLLSADEREQEVRNVRQMLTVMDDLLDHVRTRQSLLNATDAEIGKAG